MPRKKQGPVRRVLSSARLKELYACRSQRRRFNILFGRGAEVRVTRSRLMKAAEAGLRVDWLASRLMGARDRETVNGEPYPRWLRDVGDLCLGAELRAAFDAWSGRGQARHLANALRLP